MERALNLGEIRKINLHFHFLDFIYLKCCRIAVKCLKIDRTDSKLKGNFPKTMKNAYTGNTQILVYTQDFTVGP